MEKSLLKKFILPEELRTLLENKEVILAESREDLIDLSFGRSAEHTFEVSYDTPGFG
jgi:hypothetical protein